jgi:hypothetical protein
MQKKGRSVHTALTSNGRVELCRQRYHGAQSGSVAPVDRLLDVAEATVSLGVRELCCRIGSDSGSFARAAATLGRAAQLRLSDEKLRQVVENEGKAVLAWQEHGEQLEFDWEAKDCLTDTPEGERVSRVYVGSDGVLVPMVTDGEKRKRHASARARRKRLPRRKGLHRRPLSSARRGADQRYKEFKLVTMYDQDQSRRLVRLTRKDHREACRLMRRMAGDLKLKQAQQKVAVSDGAEWIARQIQTSLPRDTTVILDFYHFAQHVHEARRVVFGELDAAGQSWAGDLLHAIRHDEDEGFTAVWEKLLATRSRQRSPSKRRALDGLMQYAASRRDKIDYKRFESQGLSIGSGPTESMCKALTRRLKGSGMRWNGENAEAVATLEAIHQSARWSAYWSKRLQNQN